MPKIQGFPPIADRNAKLLVLGSMPSAASLAQQQYYAHPRNAFWPIMGALFGAHPDLDYRERQTILKRCHIAVWDVLANCRRNGSADSGIAVDSMQTNDFAAFFRSHPDLGWVFFNGGTAETIFKRLVLPHIQTEIDGVRFSRMPSTSPAYASMGLPAKIAAWRAVQDVLTGQ